MLEHIFRNLTDIRVFDVFYVEYSCLDGSLDIDQVLDYLDYPQREYIQVEDSINHLVRQKILKVVSEKAITSSGCKTCKFLDVVRIPRFGDHKNHIPYEEKEINVPAYRLAENKITKYLFKAIFWNVFEIEIEDNCENN